MDVFELLGIKQGDIVEVDNPWSDSGPRDIVPLALSKNGISIRAVDTRYGDICYVRGEWNISMSDGSKVQLKEFPYISQKIKEWSSRNLCTDVASKQSINISLEDIKQEFSTLDEILNIIDLSNIKVSITGTLPIPRAHVKYLLESKGAIVMGNVSKQTKYLFMGQTGRHEITSKMKKAHSLGVKIITL